MSWEAQGATLADIARCHQSRMRQLCISMGLSSIWIDRCMTKDGCKVAGAEYPLHDACRVLVAKRQQQRRSMFMQRQPYTHCHRCQYGSVLAAEFLSHDVCRCSCLCNRPVPGHGVVVCLIVRMCHRGLQALRHYISRDASGDAFGVEWPLQTHLIVSAYCC